MRAAWVLTALFTLVYGNGHRDLVSLVSYDPRVNRHACNLFTLGYLANVCHLTTDPVQALVPPGLRSPGLQPGHIHVPAVVRRHCFLIAPYMCKVQT